MESENITLTLTQTWTKVSGMIEYAQRLKIYELVARPAVVYDLEVVALRKRQETELKVTEMNVNVLFRSDMVEYAASAY